MQSDKHVVMPQLGESIIEATLVRWRVSPGDRVVRGQILAEVETDKATNEIPAPRDGVVGALLVEEGALIPVGTKVLVYQDGEPTKAAALPVPDRLPDPVSGSAAPLRSSAAAERLPSRRLAPRPEGRIASPAVRRLARERSIDLVGVRGSGPRGRITKDDVLISRVGRDVAERPSAESDRAPIREPNPREAARFRVYRPPRHEAQPGDRSVPFSRRRSYIAEHMVYSLGTAAHVAAATEIDMSAVMRAKQDDSVIAEQQGIKLTLTAYLVAALARALNEYPELNATVAGDSLVLRAEKNIGVAVDTEEGLVVPVIKHADELGILGIARNLSELSERARGGGLSAADLSGGTFSLSNPGRDGNLFGVSIIRQPEVAILRSGQIIKRPVVRQVGEEDVIVIRPIMIATLSYDHRVIDGKTGNAFLHRVRTLLEEAQPSLATLRPHRV